MALARAVARLTLPIAPVLGVLLSNVAPAAASTSPTTEFSKIFDLAKTKMRDPWGLVNPWGVKIAPVKGWLNASFRYYLHTTLTR